SVPRVPKFQLFQSFDSQSRNKASADFRDLVSVAISPDGRTGRTKSDGISGAVRTTAPDKNGLVRLPRREDRLGSGYKFVEVAAEGMDAIPVIVREFNVSTIQGRGRSKCSSRSWL